MKTLSLPRTAVALLLLVVTLTCGGRNLGTQNGDSGIGGSGTITPAVQTGNTSYDGTTGNGIVYTFVGWDGTNTNGNYPASMTFKCANTGITMGGSGAADTFPVTVAIDNSHVYTGNTDNGETFFGVRGHGLGGISILATSGANTSCPAPANGYIAAIDTGSFDMTGLTGVRIFFEAAQISNQTREYGLRLQYSINGGTSFTDVAGPIEFRSDTAGTSTAYHHFGPVAIAAVDGQSQVVFRWRYFSISGTAGSRTRIAIRNIRISTDATIPTFAGVTTATAASSSAINLSWADATDDVTTASYMRYDIYQATTSGGQNYTALPVATVRGATSAQITGLNAGTEYFFVVRARDEQGNRESNTIQANATTSADTTPPTVTTFNPANGTNHSTTSDVSVTFDRAMTPATVTTASLKVVAGTDCSAAGIAASGVTPSGGNTIFTLNLTGTRNDGQQYTTCVTTGVQSAAGIAMTIPASAGWTGQGPCTSIENLRTQITGTNVTVSCTITDAYVTYVFTNGFTFQKTQGGEALFVFTSTAPTVAVGNRITISATQGTLFSQLRQLTQTGFTIDANDSGSYDVLTNLATTFNNGDTMNDAMESKLVRTTQTGNITALGANENTLRLNGGATDYFIRSGSGTPDFQCTGRTFTVTRGVVDRFNALFRFKSNTADVTMTNSCPFNVTAASATANTTLTVTFSDAPNSGQAQTAGNYEIVLAASACGSGAVLAASAPSLSGSVVTLTTAAQTGGTSYKVCVSNVTRNSDGAALTTANFNFTGNAGGVTHLVISQVYGGGNNAGAPYQNDFIELFNPTNASISVNGWSVQYTSAAGTTWTNITNLPNVSIPAYSYFLIQQAGGTTNGVALPTPDATGSIAMAAGAGKVALVNSTTALTTASFTGTAPTGATIVDFVGFGGTATYYEGVGPTPAPSNTNAVIRGNSGCTDTNSNNTDFTAGAPNPRNSASSSFTCP